MTAIMTTGLILLSSLILVFALMRARQEQGADSNPEDLSVYPYLRDRKVFNKTHQEFFSSLIDAVDGAAYICPNVCAGAFIKTIHSLATSSNREYWENALQKYSFDYLLIDPDSSDVICAIDLQVEDAPELIENDFGRDLCRSIRLPFIRFQQSSPYDKAAVRAILLAYLPESEQLAEILPTLSTQEIGLICPSCSSLLVKQKVRNGSLKGRFFWVCSSRKKCRYVEPLTA